jgi:hypothetical protein
VVIKPDRSDKTESKKFFLKISDHQQRWSRPLPGAILIPPALLVVADFPDTALKSQIPILKLEIPMIKTLSKSLFVDTK